MRTTLPPHTHPLIHLLADEAHRIERKDFCRYGIEEAGYYTFALERWARACEWLQETPLLSAILAVKNKLTALNSTTFITRLERYQEVLNSGLLSEEDKNNGTANIVVETDINKLINGAGARERIVELASLCKEAATFWNNSTEFQEDLTKSLEKILSDIEVLENKRINLLKLIVLEGEIPPLTRYKADIHVSSYEEPALQEFLNLHSGFRPGTKVLDGYVLVDANAVAEDLLRKGYGTVYANMHAISFARQDIQTYRSILKNQVIVWLSSQFVKASDIMVAKLNEKAGMAADLAFKLKHVTAALALFETPLPKTRKRNGNVINIHKSLGRRGPSRPRQIKGIDTYFRKGIYIDPDSFGENALAEFDRCVKSPTETSTVGQSKADENGGYSHLGHKKLFSLAVVERWANTLSETERENLIARIAPLLDLDNQCNGDIAVYYAYFNDMRSQQMKLMGAKSTYMLKFTIEQDRLIDAHWRPRTDKERKDMLIERMPEHPWERIASRGKLLAALCNAGYTIEDANNLEAVRKVTNPFNCQDFKRGLGGHDRVRVPNQNSLPLAAQV